MSKKSLDILEEQLFGLLEDYVPQTGRGFSDGNAYIGKNTKRPYEDRMAEADSDKPWYKKVYKKDSKNVKILIGHGTKTPKHAKKGGPYTKDPPARRPVDKLSAPPMALQEDINKLDPKFVDAFMKIQSADITFQTQEDVEKLSYLVFKAGKPYDAKINGDNISVYHEEIRTAFGREDNPKKMTKKDFLEDLSEKGQVCDTVKCDVSTITINGKKLTFDQFMQATAQPAPQPDQKQEPATIQGQQQAEAQQNAQRAVGIGQRVANGASIQTAIKQEIGYNPITKKFAENFYNTMKPAVDAIKDPDERKIAALTTILFGEISVIPVELVSDIYTSIDPETIKQLSGIVDGFLKDFAPEIMNLKQKYDELMGIVKEPAEMIKKGAQTIQKNLENLISPTKLKDIPPASLNNSMYVIIGDQQRTILFEEFKGFFSTKGYNTLNKDFNVQSGQSFSEIASDDIVNHIENNKDKIGLIFISYGSRSSTDAVSAGLAIAKFRAKAPNSIIVWVGSPPVSTGVNDHIDINKDLEGFNNAMQAASSTTKQFIFINSTDVLNEEDTSNFQSDGIKLTKEGAKIIFNSALEENEADTQEEPDAKEEEEPDAKEEEEPNTDEDSDDPKDHIKELNLYKQLKEELKTELIKLNKKAKKKFGKDTKIHISSGISGHSGNHTSGYAVDMRFTSQGREISAQETYAFIINSILDGTIKDGGVGYYANNRGHYNSDSMDTSTEYPHYDVHPKKGARKWFWFKCKKNNEDMCKEVSKKDSFQRCVRIPKKDDKGNIIPGEYILDCSKSQTLGGTAKNIINSSNPMGLPKDVFRLLGSNSSSNEKTASTTEKESSQNINSNVQLIKQRFTEAEIPDNLTKAAIVNSWFESGWVSNLEGDIVTKVGGDCAREVQEEEGPEAYCGGGLFGIHSCGGMGGCRSTASGMKNKSMSLDDIKDPEKSIAKMINYIKKGRTNNILKKAQQGATAEELVEHFCRYVERPRNSNIKCPNRKSKTAVLLKKAGIE